LKAFCEHNLSHSAGIRQPDDLEKEG